MWLRGVRRAALPLPRPPRHAPRGPKPVYAEAAGHNAGDAIGAVVAGRPLDPVHANYAVLSGNSPQHGSELAIQDSSRTRSHDRGHFRRVETIRVDREA